MIDMIMIDMIMIDINKFKLLRIVLICYDSILI